MIEFPQVVQPGGQAKMLRPERLLKNPQGPLIQHLGLFIGPGRLIQPRQVDKGGCHIGMLRPHGFLGEFHCALCERKGFGIFSGLIQFLDSLVQCSDFIELLLAGGGNRTRGFGNWNIRTDAADAEGERCQTCIEKTSC
jgi:hypothetical protein